MKKVKKLFALISILTGVTMLVACGNDGTQEKENSKDNGKVTGYTSKEIYDIVSGAMKDIPEMDTVTSDDENAESVFLVFSELDYDKVEDFVISYSKVGLADEIVVVHTKSGEDVEELKDDLEERLESRKGTFEEYNPEEQTKFTGACVLAQDNCVVLLIGNQAQNGKYEFNKLFDK